VGLGDKRVLGSIIGTTVLLLTNFALVRRHDAATFGEVDVACGIHRPTEFEVRSLVGEKGRGSLEEKAKWIACPEVVVREKGLEKARAAWTSEIGSYAAVECLGKGFVGGYFHCRGSSDILTRW